MNRWAVITVALDVAALVPGVLSFAGLMGVVVVAQTLYTSTMEHFKEFAMVKAMGGEGKRFQTLLRLRT